MYGGSTPPVGPGTLMTDIQRHARPKTPSDSGGGDSADPTPDRIVPEGESIRSVVDSASAGDVIRVGNGLYSEQVVVDEEVTLVGAEPGATWISAPSTVETRFDHESVGVHPVGSLETDGRGGAEPDRRRGPAGRRHRLFRRRGQPRGESSCRLIVSYGLL
jgi:hypothetical protein